MKLVRLVVIGRPWVLVKAAPLGTDTDVKPNERVARQPPIIP
jgi:hypothetical protein